MDAKLSDLGETLLPHCAGHPFAHWRKAEHPAEFAQEMSKTSSQVVPVGSMVSYTQVSQASPSLVNVPFAQYSAAHTLSQGFPEPQAHCCMAETASMAPFG
jgi:hypothetical protein